MLYPRAKALSGGDPIIGNRYEYFTLKIYVYQKIITTNHLV